MLRSLYLNGNFVGSNGELPQQFSQLSANLVDLGISGCNIKSLPSYFTSFRQMRYLDARDNRISSLPEEMTEWIKSLGMEAYNNTGLCDDANFCTVRHCVAGIVFGAITKTAIAMTHATPISANTTGANALSTFCSFHACMLLILLVERFVLC